jgi:hypothetical protein
VEGTHQTATQVIETGLLTIAGILATGLGMLGFIKVAPSQNSQIRPQIGIF